MQRRAWTDFLVVAAAASAVHGLLLLDAGTYFDDWLIHTYVVKGEWHLLAAIVRDRGIPPVESYYWSLFQDLPVFAYRAAAFAMIVGCAWLAMLVGRATTFLSRRESLLAALFIVCYSGFLGWVLFCTSQYVLFYCLFLAAALLAIHAEHQRGWRHWTRRAAALSLFAVSYCLGSLLFLTFVFGVVLLLHVKKMQSLTVGQVLVSVLPRRIDYFVLPVVYRYVIHWLIPPRGLHEGYNTILRSPSLIVSNIAQFADNSIVVQVRSAFEALVTHPLVFLAAAACTAAVWLTGHRSGETDGGKSKWLLPFAVAWVLAAMFPYAAVNKPAAATGWDTRHAILLSFPLGVVLVGLGRLLETRRSLPRLAGIFAVLALSAGMAVTTMQAYVDLQARAIRDESVMRHLAAAPEARLASVFWIQQRVPYALGEDYRYYEWAGMFERTFGDQARAGFDRKTYPTSDVLATDVRFFTDRYRLKDFDPAGCQVEVTIDWGPVLDWGLEASPGSWSVVRLYHRLRLSGRTEQLARFLDDVTTVGVNPREAPEATRCRRTRRE